MLWVNAPNLSAQMFAAFETVTAKNHCEELRMLVLGETERF